MERGGGSGESSRVVANSRSSSGCLIVKKKCDGVGRIGSSSGNRRNSQCKKEKKRSRIVSSDSESSDELLEPPRRRVDCEMKRDRIKLDDNDSVRRNDKDLGARKRNKLDVFEFDEYDGFESAMLMRKHLDGVSVGVSSRSSDAPRRHGSGNGWGSGSGRDSVLERRKKSYINGTCSFSSQENGTSHSDSDEPVRLQGRNGVLKVIVNKKKTMDEPVRSFGQLKYTGIECGSKSLGPYKKSTPAASIGPRAEFYEKPVSSMKAPKHENILVKPISSNSSDGNDDSDSDDSNMLMKLKKRKSERCKSKNMVNYKLGKTIREPLKPSVIKERKVKGGGGTEKQRLRERIKGMLIDAGWTIDYRPRRNKDYVDAVYVNPSGTAYWSIIKAYDALLKQLNDEENDAGSGKDAAAVASISEDILSKLARKTKKNITTRMMKKQQKYTSGSDSEKETDGDEEGITNCDAHEEKSSSLVKSVGKSSRKRLNGITDVVGLHSKNKSSLYHNNERPFCGLNSHKLNGRKSNKLGRCTLLVRSSRDEKNSEINGFSPYSGKRTLLSWLIDSGVAQQSQKVQYMNRRRTKVMLEGWITRDGIHCGCCSKILSLSRFEIHAGSKLHQPFQNIYLESGISLLQCQSNAWNMQEDAENLCFYHVDTDGDDPNDDTCGICGDGGDLICCDGCPSTYHQICLGMQSLPLGDWHCPNCTCKFCGAAADSSNKDGNFIPLLCCNMCEKKYHQLCMSEKDAHKVQSVCSVPSFCGPKCFELFGKLQKYLGVKNELKAGFSWSLIHRVDIDADLNPQAFAERIEINSKLAVGLSIMDECFLPIVDRRSGVNLIRNVLYNSGSNFNRINYTGFYTAILERGDEIISAASLRFHGTQLAEMPFIGTRHIYRRQGMCRRLFDAIESAMRFLKVEKLVIPAIPDFLHAWTGNFGFSPLEDSIKKEMRSLNTLVFPGIDMLQKPLLVEGNTSVAAGFRNLEDKGDHLVIHEDAITYETETEKKYECDSSAEIGADSHKVNDKCVRHTVGDDFVAFDEEKIPALVETTMSTIPKHSPGREYHSSSSAYQMKQVPGLPCEDTGSSCEAIPSDANIETDGSLRAQELPQASANNEASVDYGVEDNISLPNSYRGLMSSIIPCANTQPLHTLDADFHSCKGNNNMLGDICTSGEDQAARRRLRTDEKSALEQFGSDDHHPLKENSGNEEKPASSGKMDAVAPSGKIHQAAQLNSRDIEAVQSKVHAENGHDANGCVDGADKSLSVNKLAD